MKSEWFFCFPCGGPSMICTDCDEPICNGGCKHATELFEKEPKFWDEDDVRNKMGLISQITEERARSLIREWNDYGRKEAEGCLGIFKKEDIHEM